MENLTELRKAERFLKKHTARERNAWKKGEQLAQELFPGPRKIIDTSYAAHACAGLFDALAQRETSLECVEQLFQWTFDHFWGRQVQRLLDSYELAWTYLQQHQHLSRADSIEWGDADYSLWAEPTDDGTHVVMLESHCTAADDNLYLFIAKHTTSAFFREFHIRTCWPRTTRHGGFRGKTGWDFVACPSLALFRQQRFTPQYGDFRDVGYVLTYSGMGDFGKVDGGYTHGARMYWGLWHLQLLIRIIAEDQKADVYEVEE
jgi:hypothetical protein